MISLSPGEIDRGARLLGAGMSVDGIAWLLRCGRDDVLAALPRLRSLAGFYARRVERLQQGGVERREQAPAGGKPAAEIIDLASRMHRSTGPPP